MCMDPVNLKIIAVPELEIPMILDGPKRWRREKESTRGYRRRYIMMIGRENFKLKRCWIHLWDGMKSKI